MYMPFKPFDYFNDIVSTNIALCHSLFDFF